MDELGDCARGVVVIDPEASDEEIAALDRRGVPGVGAFMLGGGPYAWHDLPTLRNASPHSAGISKCRWMVAS